MEFFREPLLALETSCDETSTAVLLGRKVLSNAVASQLDLHAKWGGVVPEAAARAHVEAVLPIVSEALTLASVELKDIRAVAVTNRPGLLAALSVGVTCAKSIAFSLGVPLVGVNHLEGHVMSTYAADNQEAEAPGLPHVALVVSGGHTELVQMEAVGCFELLGQTIDDAAGEAFDKGARLLGLGSPGGYAIQQAALAGDPHRYALPKGLAGDTIDFSFSGLKTALLRLVEKEGKLLSIPDAAASLQHTIVEVLCERALRAAERRNAQEISLVGGVSANLALRQSLAARCERAGIRLWLPDLSLSTDNAAMIGLAGSVRLASGEADNLDLDCFPNAPLGK